MPKLSTLIVLLAVVSSLALLQLSSVQCKARAVYFSRNNNQIGEYRLAIETNIRPDQLGLPILFNIRPILPAQFIKDVVAADTEGEFIITKPNSEKVKQGFFLRIDQTLCPSCMPGTPPEVCTCRTSSAMVGQVYMQQPTAFDIPGSYTASAVLAGGIKVRPFSFTIPPRSGEEVVKANVQSSDGEDKDGVFNVTYAELVKNHATYAGKKVRVSGILVAGFETYALAEKYSSGPAITSQPLIWIVEGVAAGIKVETWVCKGGDGLREVRYCNATVEGTFMSQKQERGLGYGHLGQYPFQIGEYK